MRPKLTRENNGELEIVQRCQEDNFMDDVSHLKYLGAG